MATLPSRTILVADDSAIVVRVVRRRLERRGFDVVEATSAADCRSIDATSLAAAVFDLQLGDAEGAVSAARLLAHNPTVRVAFYSGCLTSERVGRAQALGPVFDKASDLEALLDWLCAEGTVSAVD